MNLGIELNNKEEMLKIIDFINCNDVTFKYLDNYLFIKDISHFRSYKDSNDYIINIKGLELIISKDIINYISVF